MSRALSAADAWRQLPAPWQASFEQAWEAFEVGSPPVGAVVTDASGTIVTRGRSRRAETVAPPNQLAGSRLAHAEINALAQLRPDQYDGYHLYTTLEPCFLCSAAMAIAHVEVLHFAGSDPMWRPLNELSNGHPALAERGYTSHGPMPGRLGAWAMLLPIVERLQRRPQGRRVEEFARMNPELVGLAQRLIKEGAVEDLARGSLEDALTRLWDDLLAAFG